MIKSIKAVSGRDIMDLNRAAVEAPYSVWVQGQNIMLNAKSFMGLFALPAGNELKLIVPDDVDSGDLLRKLNRLIVH